MKRVFWTVLVVCLLIVPARAEETPNLPAEEYVQNSHVVVATLDELQEAIAVANNGDTIEISQMIKMIGGILSTDKEITIACAENFEGYCMFNVVGASVTGLSFKGGNVGQIFAVTDYQGQETIFRDCVFDGDNVTVAISAFGTAMGNSVRIIESEFKNCFRNAISGRPSTDIVIDRCYIHDTYAMDASAAVDSSGKVTLNNCIVTGNSSVANAGVLCTGTLIVSGGQIRDNTIRSTDVGVAVDIFCRGTWSITDEGTGDAGYYDAATGKKLSLPIHESNTLARLVYLKDENAKEYFSFLFEPDTSEGNENDIPELPQEPVSPPVDDEEGDDPPEQIPEPPKEPADSGEEKDEGDPSVKQPETPDQPLQGEDGNISDDDTPQSPEQPINPPQDDTIADTTPPDTPQQPQEPVDSPPNYIPYWPSVRPVWPIVTTTIPTDEPQIETEIPARNPLICNGATIDTSKTIVLLGYGDGQLHEADSLTRAQLATIIFRLLDDDTIIRYGGAGVMFTDVAADAWYAPYVNAIGMAGIVNGVGNGMYDPDGTATWAQIITILTRFVESESCELKYIQYDGWASEAIQTAVALGWIEDSSIFNPNDIISRGELVDLINTVLEQY
ncbi:MAG: hypothetical protein HFF61_03710 [Oscillospiraceae bacterium]|nr:hypothetical protein [Oscillospiraceae bacterium]